MGTGISIVVPTLGRPSLARLLRALAPADGVLPMPVELILVDDRRDPSGPLADLPPALAPVTRVLPGRAAGPAAARNVGWRAAAYPWIAFLDDDVVPQPDWLACLEDDLDIEDELSGDALPAGQLAGLVGVQGIVEVPLPEGRRPTDWERVTSDLAGGRWITADMAYRRRALVAVGGFDERFPRAFREDTDLAYRMRRAGGALAVGRRRVTHSVRAESPWVSLRTQAGNADDALLRHLYGPRWRELLEVPPGRRPRHVLVTAAGLVALGAVAAGRSRFARGLAGIAGVTWLAGTAEFAVARITPGPRSVGEVGRMVVTSALIPPYAVAHWLRGWLRRRPTVHDRRGSCPADRIGAHG
jgi:glycosyltransferase involved in cell wall biosynthesis